MSTNTLSNSTDGENDLITSHSPNRNYLLTIPDHARVQLAADVSTFDVNTDNTPESEANSGIKPSTHEPDEKAVGSHLAKVDTNGNQKVLQMKSIAKEANSDSDDELPVEYMQQPLTKKNAKRRGVGAEHGIRMIQLHSKLSIATHQSPMNHARPRVIGHTIHLARQKVATNEHNTSYIETVRLSSLNSTPKLLGVIPDVSTVSSSNVLVKHIHIHKKSEKSKEAADSVQSVVEMKQKKRKHKTTAQAMVVVLSKEHC
jgi:hypothetical protein